MPCELNIMCVYIKERYMSSKIETFINERCEENIRELTQTVTHLTDLLRVKEIEMESLLVSHRDLTTECALRQTDLDIVERERNDLRILIRRVDAIPTIGTTYTISMYVSLLYLQYNYITACVPSNRLYSENMLSLYQNSEIIKSIMDYCADDTTYPLLRDIAVAVDNHRDNIRLSWCPVWRSFKKELGGEQVELSASNALNQAVVPVIVMMDIYAKVVPELNNIASIGEPKPPFHEIWYEMKEMIMQGNVYAKFTGNDLISIVDADIFRIPTWS